MISSIYSIGHGQKSPEEFISELKSFDIHYLIDVRTSPFSKWSPQFNRGVIEGLLSANGIRYVYMGDVIGGRPLSDDCYDEEGHYDYEKMAQVPAFKDGVNRLVNAHEKGIKVAVMCSESDPSMCHRSKLIGRELLAEYDINMHHITAVGKCVDETDIITLLTKGSWSPNATLFGPVSPPFFKSRGAYKNEEYKNEPNAQYYG